MANVQKFTVELELGATLKAGEQTWIKPGLATSITFNQIPEKDQLDTALHFMHNQILEPVMEEVVDTAIKYARKAEGLE